MRKFLALFFTCSLIAFGLESAFAASAPVPSPSINRPTMPAPEKYLIAPGESEVKYKVGEVFINRGNTYNLAIGITKTIEGEITADPANLPASAIGPITIDISKFASDSPLRDQRIRDQWLESAKFPLAVFTPTQIDGLPESATPGEEIAIQITGDLKVRDAVKATTFDTKIKFDGDTITGFATTKIQMTDFGFQPPDILGILKAENDAILEFTFVAKKAG